MLFVAFMLSASMVSAQTAAPAAAASAGRIAGRVVAGGTHAPLSGARVMLIPTGRRLAPPALPAPPAQAVTDQDGRYAFENVAAGTYHVQLEKSGYAPPVMDVGLVHTVTIAAGQILDGIDVELTLGGAIAGRVLDPSGAPLTEARVMVLRRMGSGNPNSGTGGAPRLIPAPAQGQQTNDLGEFRVYGLPAGEYAVAVSPRPAVYFGAAGVTPLSSAAAATTVLATTYYPGTLDPNQAQPVAVTSGATVENISFSIQSVTAFRVAGVVVDTTGAPIGGAMVMLMADPRSGGMLFGPGASARTQDDGTFVLVGVAPGTYRVNASVMTMMGSGSGGIGGITFSASTATAPLPRPAEVTVADGDVTGVQVVVRR